MLDELRTTDSGLDLVLTMLQFSEADLECLAKVGPLIGPKLPALNATLYEVLAGNPATLALLGNNVDVDALMVKLLDWLKSLFTGTLDEDFVKYQEQIGYKHGKYKVAPTYVAPTMTLLRLEIPKLVSEAEATQLGKTKAEVTTAILKLLDITHFLMDRNYHARLIENTGMSQALLERLMAA